MGCPGPIASRSALTCTGEVSFARARNDVGDAQPHGLSVVGGMPSRQAAMAWPVHLLSLVPAPSSAARPASSRATGTRNGEQET